MHTHFNESANAQEDHHKTAAEQKLWSLGHLADAVLASFWDDVAYFEANSRGQQCAKSLLTS